MNYYVTGVSTLEEKVKINTLLNGKSLKEYKPKKYLKKKKHLFDIENVTFVEMLFLVLLDKNGKVSTSIKFRPKFLAFLKKNNYSFFAWKQDEEYNLIDRSLKQKESESILSLFGMYKKSFVLNSKSSLLN